MTTADTARDPVLVVVARLEGSLNTFAASTNGKLDHLSEKVGSVGTDVQDLERRIGNLESWRNRLAGALGVVLFLTTLLTTFVLTHWHISIQP